MLFHSHMPKTINKLNFPFILVQRKDSAANVPSPITQFESLESPTATSSLEDEITVGRNKRTVQTFEATASQAPQPSISPSVITNNIHKNGKKVLHFLSSGEKLYCDDYLSSPMGICHLVLQKDGNLVLYKTLDWRPTNILWSSNTAHLFELERRKNTSSLYSLWLEMQNDGDLVLFLAAFSPPSASYSTPLKRRGYTSSNPSSSKGDLGSIIASQYQPPVILWRSNTASNNNSSNNNSNSNNNNNDNNNSSKVNSNKNESNMSNNGKTLHHLFVFDNEDVMVMKFSRKTSSWNFVSNLTSSTYCNY